MTGLSTIKTIPLNNKTIQLGNIEWNIQEEIARGSSIIAYKVFNEKFGVAILKEYYPIELEPFAKDFKPEKEQEEIKDSNNNKNLE